MIDTDKFVGNELSIRATSDLETPSKKILLKVAKEEGIKWAKEDHVGFKFVDRAMCAAIDYALSENDKQQIQQVMMFGFIAGVIEYVNEKEDKDMELTKLGKSVRQRMVSFVDSEPFRQGTDDYDSGWRSGASIGYQTGAYSQHKIDIDKACKWLEEHSVVDSEMFRKAMED